MNNSNFRTPKYDVSVRTVPDDEAEMVPYNHLQSEDLSYKVQMQQGSSSKPRFQNTNRSYAEMFSSHPVSCHMRHPQTVSSTSSSELVERQRVLPGGFSNLHSGDTSRWQTPYMRRGLASANSRFASGGRISSCGSSSVTPAVMEGRGSARGEIGMACIDLKHPVLILSQFTDTQGYVHLLTQLNVYYPTEILMSNSMCDSGPCSKLFKLISENFPDSTTVTVQRKYFNETTGIQRVRELCAPQYKTVEMEVIQKYYCLAACAALIRYVEFIQNIMYASSSLKIVFRVSADTVMIDTATAARLELVTNASASKSMQSLYGILKRTSTNGGSRLLRANLLQPPSDLLTIQTRLECISELVEKEDMYQSLKTIMTQFADADQILSLCVTLPKEENMRTIEQKISNVICLKHVLDHVVPLRDILVKSENRLFRMYYQGLCDPQLAEIKEKIGVVIHSDVRCQKGALNSRLQKCFAVKPDINGLLDVARRTYTETVSDISDLVQQLAEQYQLPFNIGYSAARGFFIQLQYNPKNNNAAQTLPSCFLKVTRTKKLISCTTSDLIKMNDRVKQSLNEIYLMSNVIISELLKVIRGNIGCLYSLVEAISTIDFLLSIASYCAINQCVKPKFAESLVIKNGRHPILEKVGAVPAVPNNTFISAENNFIIITGPNMSGKTTYLKQVALLQVMAQVGCYVPAEYASFRIMKQIFSRMGSNDSIENNFSAFMLEMKEASYIMSNALEQSLVIIDELGKSTSYEEGVSLAWAISEEIIFSKAFTMFATHYPELTQLEAIYPNAVNHHLPVHYSVSEDRQTLVPSYTYTLEKGRCKEENYGLKLAEMSALPSAVIEYAQRIVSELEENKQTDALETVEHRQRRETIQLAVHILQLVREDSLEEEEILNHIRCLQNQFSSPVSNDERLRVQSNFATN